MALTLAILGMLAAVLPVVLGIIKDARDAKAGATRAIRKRDRDVLRAELERLDRLRALADTAKSLPPRGEGGV